MTDLTPEREQEIRDFLAGHNEISGLAFIRVAEELLAALDAERARAENTEKFLSKTQDRVEHLEAMNLRALGRLDALEAVAEAARDAVHRHPGQLKRLRAALAVLEEPPA